VVASLQNLTVRYGSFTALDSLSAEIPEGCVGLLGPNGAGKTTLIKTMLGFLTPAGGGGLVLGLDIRTQGREIRQKVGLMPEQDCHIPGLNAVQFVAFAGELAGMPSELALRRAHEVLEYCGLGEARYRNVETYSTGMKQRIKLAQALVHGPSLLLLDEPTNGLDPRGREEMLDLIRSVSHGKGVNVIVSSHLLPDVERVCDHVVVVSRGKVTEQGAIARLKVIEGRPIDIELKEESPEFVRAMRDLGATVEATGLVLRVRLEGSAEQVSATIFRTARETGAQVRGLAVAQRSLEGVFEEAVRA